MIETEGKFLRQVNNIGYVGRVWMDIKESSNSIIETSYITGYQNEWVYSEWLEGAKIGARYALKKYARSNYKI